MEEERKHAITHVIFDLDGLLIETESLYTRVTQNILDRYGKTFEWSLKSRIMGRPPLLGAKMVVDSLQLPLEPQVFLDELHEKLDAEFPHASLMPGAERLICHFRDQNIPMAVATGSARVQYELKVKEKDNLFSCILHAVCSDDPGVEHGKPSPDIYLVAASKFTSPPKSLSNVLVFEDAPNGVEAAKKAGMVCVMVPDKRTDKEKTKMADEVLESLNDINLAKYGLSPLP